MTSPPSPGPVPPQDDWPQHVTERIESVVSSVRKRTTVPATLAARAVVYGLVAGALGAALFIAFMIGLVRLVDVYLPFHPMGRRVWVVDAGGAAIFMLAGALLWRRRKPKNA